MKIESTPRVLLRPSHTLTATVRLVSAIQKLEFSSEAKCQS